jgi:protein phosphatase
MWLQAVATQMTGVHRVDQPEERQRLQAAGVTLQAGEKRLYGLAVSRALGDTFLKSEGVPLLADPHVSAPFATAQGESTLVLLASDGLWDVVSPQKVRQLLRCTHLILHSVDSH